MKFIGFSIDKLELCYTASTDALHYLAEESEFEYDGLFYKKTCHNNARIQYNVSISDAANEKSGALIGTLRLSLSDFYNDNDVVYVWIALDNKFLYSFPEQKCVLDYLDIITDTLKLKLNNVTKCEIACDVNTNAVASIRKLVRTTEYDIIVMGRHRKNPDEVINELIYEVFESRLEEKKRQLRIKGEDSKFQMYCYDKLSEIQKSGKQYILDYYEINPQTLWRMEVRFDKEHSKTIIQQLNTTLEAFLEYYLFNDYGRVICWKFISKKFIRFRKNRDYIKSVLDFDDLKILKF